MIDKKHIEQFLHLNGLTPTSPDEEIRSLLISARWHRDDVEAALVVLREDPIKHTQRIDSVHRVISSDQKLQPETLSALLGIDVQVQSVVTEHQQALEHKYRSQVLSIVLLSILGSFMFLLIAMWFLKVGIFHEYALQL